MKRLSNQPIRAVWRWLRCLVRFQSLLLWCALAIPSGLIAAVVMYGWAHITGENPMMEALGGFLGIAWSFPLIGVLQQLLEANSLSAGSARRS